MRSKGAASARGSGRSTPAQRNLLSARPNSDLDAAELQKDGGSGLQAGRGMLSAAATQIRPLPPPEGENYGTRTAEHLHRCY